MGKSDSPDVPSIAKKRQTIREESLDFFNGELKSREGGTCLGNTGAKRPTHCRKTIALHTHTVNMNNLLDIGNDGALDGEDLKAVILVEAPKFCCKDHNKEVDASKPFDQLLRAVLLLRKKHPEHMRFPRRQTHHGSSCEGTRTDSAMGYRDIYAETATTDVNTTDRQSAHTLVMERGFRDIQACLEAGFAKLCGTQAEPVVCDIKVDSDKDTIPINISPESFVTLAQFTKFGERVVGMFSTLGEVQDKHAKKFKTFSKDLRKLAEVVRSIEDIVLTEKSNPELSEHIARSRELMASLKKQTRVIARGYSSE
ncbi:hypothetical protein Q7P36_009804 [Cladosporium allicinum]